MRGGSTSSGIHRVATASAVQVPRGVPDRERRAQRRLLEGPLRVEDGVLARVGDERACPATTAALLALHVESLERGVIAAEDVHEVRTDAASLAVVLARGLDERGLARTSGVYPVLDTALIGAALDGLARLNPALDPRSVACRKEARAFVQGCLREGRGQRGAPDAAADHNWVLSFAPHLLRVAAFVGRTAMEPYIARFIAGYWHGGWFLANRSGGRPVPRAHGHALEGLAILQAEGARVPAAVLHRGTASLLTACTRRTRSGTLARALRIGVLAGAAPLELERVDGLLASREDAVGGMLEDAGSDAVEVGLASICTLQARRWMRIGASAGHLA